MTLRSLEIFVTVVKYGKMSEASKQLHISQPTISQAISELEQEYNVKLFNRLSKKLYITDAGKHLLTFAQTILALRDEMNKSMMDLSANKIIKVGATMTVGKCMLVDIVSEFEEMYPSIKLYVVIDNTATIEQMLLDSELDIAIVEGDIRSNDLHCTPICRDTLVLVCHPDHPLSDVACISIETLSQYPFILREKGSGTRDIFEKHLRNNNVSIDIKWSCHGSDSIIESILANQGLTVISYMLVEDYIYDEVLHLVDICNIRMDRNFSLVHHKTKYLSDDMKNFITYLDHKLN